MKRTYLLVVITLALSASGPVVPQTPERCEEPTHLIILPDGSSLYVNYWDYEPGIKTTTLYGPSPGRVFCDGFERP